MNSCECCACDLVPRPSSFYPVFSVLPAPAPISHIHQSSFPILHPVVLRAHHELPTSPPHHQSSAVVKKSFLIKDILSDCESLQETEAGKQDKIQNTTSGLHTSPSSTFSFPDAPTCEEQCEQVKLPWTTRRFLPAQLDKLEAMFTQNQYVSIHERILLANETGLKPTQIRTWFQNRRKKYREKLQRTDPTLKSTKAKGHPPFFQTQI